MSPAEPGHRPRVEGEREQEILDATLDALADLGYDRLTMDAVAARAKASKATLYRRWSTKVALVIDALVSLKGPPVHPDTGDLRSDLMATFCAPGGLTDQRQVAVLASVLTAIARDADFAAAFRRDFIAPKAGLATDIFRRAQARGEVREDVDLELVAQTLPAVVLHRQFLFGDVPDTDFVARVVDQVVLPAVATPRSTTSSTPSTPQHRTHEEENA